MDTPFFSIVIPTRNRAHLLKESLQTALAQDFDDYEIVIVNNNCQDNTDEVVESLKNNKVKYYKTNQTLSMPDNWEYAWSKANGDYVLYLCDDDALLPTTLKFLAEQVLPKKPTIVSWDLGNYHYSTWVEPELRNTLSIPLQHDNITVYSTDELREKLFRFEEMTWSPRMLNCCVKREALEKIRIKLGRLFFPTCPDYAFMSIVFHLLPELYVVHRPLGIWGASPSSIGATHHRQGNQGEASKEFSKEFGDYDFFSLCPTRIPVVANYVTSTLLYVNQRLTELGVKTQSLEWQRHFLAVASALKQIAPYMPSYHEYERELIEAAAKYSPDCSQEVRNILNQSHHIRTNSIKSWIGTIIQSNQLLCRLELNLRYQGDIRNSYRFLELEKGVFAHRGSLLIKGDEMGINSLVEMSKVFNSYFDKYKKMVDQKFSLRLIK